MVTGAQQMAAEPAAGFATQRSDLHRVVSDAAETFAQQRSEQHDAATASKGEAHKLQTEMAALKLRLSNMLSSTHHNMLSMQNQISEAAEERQRAEARDKSLSAELQ